LRAVITAESSSRPVGTTKRGLKDVPTTTRYEIDGNNIRYWDGTGFTAVGDCIDGVLYRVDLSFFLERIEPTVTTCRIFLTTIFPML
jgi:hypothetical protein